MLGFRDYHIYLSLFWSLLLAAEMPWCRKYFLLLYLNTKLACAVMYVFNSQLIYQLVNATEDEREAKEEPPQRAVKPCA